MRGRKAEKKLEVSLYAQAPQAQSTWCMRQLVYMENCMGKSPILKKLCKQLSYLN